MQELSKRLKITYQALNARSNNNPNLGNVNKIAEQLGCTYMELLPPPEGYGHFYVEGEWHGIRKL